MLGLVTETSVLGALLEDTRGVVGVVLGTSEGELRAVVGSVADGDAGAAVAAALSEELRRIGALLGMGDLQVASVKAPSAARVLAQQSGAVLMIELDPKRPLTELESKLRVQAWAPSDELLERPAASSRAPTVPHGADEFADDDEDDGDTPPPMPAISATTTRPHPPPMGSSPASTSRNTARTTPPPLPFAAAPMAAPQRLTPPSIGAVTPRGTPSPTRPADARISQSMGVPHQMKSVGSGPVFTGDLEEFGLPDLLELLRNSHRTGLLMCTTQSGVGTIQLSRGMIIGADSPNALDLREHFLTSPEVTPELRRVLAALPPESFGDDLIDGALVSHDLMPRGAVERARVARIYSAFREMIGWTVGRFSFDPAVPVVTNPAFALSAQSILMQIYQEQDEQGR